MKKFKKILATISSITLMSCFGDIKSEAVKYNKNSVPYALELKKNPTEDQVFEELQKVENFINSECAKYTPKQLFENTLKYESEYLYKLKGCGEKLAEWLSNRCYFRDEFSVTKEGTLNTEPTFKLDKHYYDVVLRGGIGCCRMIVGFYSTLLTMSGIEHYVLCSETNHKNHSFIVYRVNKNSCWYVLPCGAGLLGVDLKCVSLKKYLVSLSTSESKMELAIRGPLKRSAVPAIDLIHMSRIGYNLFENTNFLMNTLIKNHNIFFNIK